MPCDLATGEKALRETAEDEGRRGKAAGDGVAREKRCDCGDQAHAAHRDEKGRAAPQTIADAAENEDFDDQRDAA